MVSRKQEERRSSQRDNMEFFTERASDGALLFFKER